MTGRQRLHIFSSLHYKFNFWSLSSIRLIWVDILHISCRIWIINFCSSMNWRIQLHTAMVVNHECVTLTNFQLNTGIFGNFLRNMVNFHSRTLYSCILLSSWIFHVFLVFKSLHLADKQKQSIEENLSLLFFWSSKYTDIYTLVRWINFPCI